MKITMLMEQVAQRSCGCLIIRSVQSQVGQGSEQPDLVKDSVGWLGLCDLQRPLLQPKPFYISMISCWITSFINEGFFYFFLKRHTVLYKSDQPSGKYCSKLNELHSLHSAFILHYVHKIKTLLGKHCCTSDLEIAKASNIQRNRTVS